MSEQVAQALIDEELHHLRLTPYSDLVAMIGKPRCERRLGQDAKHYQLEIQAFWDSEKSSDVRVMVAADDGGLGAFHPLTGDFIVRSDGTFVGESFGGK